MTVKKLVVSTYLQYVLIGATALVLFAFVRQLGGVLLTFSLAGVLAYVLNPLVRNPRALIDGAAEIVDRVRDVPYVGERVESSLGTGGRGL